MKMNLKTIAGHSISILLSCFLLSGIQAAQDFAYYVMLFFNIFGWMFFWAAYKKEVAVKMVDGLWISLPLTALSIYALVSSGSPILAASNFFFCFVTLVISFSVIGREDSER